MTSFFSSDVSPNLLLRQTPKVLLRVSAPYFPETLSPIIFSKVYMQVSEPPWTSDNYTDYVLRTAGAPGLRHAMVIIEDILYIYFIHSLIIKEKARLICGTVFLFLPSLCSCSLFAVPSTYQFYRRRQIEIWEDERRARLESPKVCHKLSLQREDGVSGA